MGTEVLGRLLVLRHKGIFHDPEVKLLAPLDRRADKEGFMKAALQALAGDLLQNGRVIRLAVGGRPDIRVRAQTLFYADWPLVATPGAEGSHCTAPRSVLNLIRSELLGNEPKEAAVRTPSLLFITRDDKMSMRGSLRNGERWKQGIATIAADHLPTLAFQEFTGKSPWLEQVASFRRAKVVVGVHGGALTNLLFCEPATLVFELGFRSPIAGHYRHLAAAMGLDLTMILLRA